MRRGLLGAFAVLLLAAPSAHAAQVVRDGSFEAAVSPGANQGGNSPNWTEADTVFDSPLCTVADVAACTNGGGTTGPRTGIWWAWFGGTSDAQTSSLSQTMVIPRGTATLSFYLWIGTPATAGTGDEVLVAKVDGAPVFTATRGTPGFGAYAPVFANVSRFATGGSHTLSFDYSNPAAGGTAVNMSVDDVSLTTKPPKKCKKKKGKKGAAAAKKCKKKKKK